MSTPDEDGPARRGGPGRRGAGGRIARLAPPDSYGPVVAAGVIAVLTLPMTVVTLRFASAPTELGTEIWVVALSAVLHAIGFLCAWRPTTAFVAGSAVMLALAVTVLPGFSSAALMPSAVTYLLLVWRLAAGDDRLRSYGALAVGFLGAAVITAVDTLWAVPRDVLLAMVEAGALIAGITAAWALGALTRQRRTAEAARRDEHTRSALAEERTRIGRDLHDVVSHSLTVMIAQAEAARVMSADPGAERALDRVAETGRAAMRGLRGMLRVLDDGGERPLEPAPGIDGIPALVERARSPEHDIRLEVRGRPHELAPDAELAAYRTVQEALTNAIRHLPTPLRVEVGVEWRQDEVEITVADDGGGAARAPAARPDSPEQREEAMTLRIPSAGADAPARGHAADGTGLIGMAERVRRAGGTLDVVRGRGWRVRAVLPAEAGA